MMGSDFEDEEIDEDEAFDSEDNDMFGHMFKGKTKADAASSRGKSDAGTEVTICYTA